PPVRTSSELRGAVEDTPTPDDDTRVRIGSVRSAWETVQHRLGPLASGNRWRSQREDCADVCHPSGICRAEQHPAFANNHAGQWITAVITTPKAVKHAVNPGSSRRSW